MITKLEELITAVKGRPKKRIVVAYAQDAHTIEAVNAAVDMGIVDATLVGDPEGDSARVYGAGDKSGQIHPRRRWKRCGLREPGGENGQ